MITRCDSFCVEGRARRVPATYQGALRRRLGCCRVRLEAMPGSRGGAGRTAARIASAAADQQIHSVEDSLYPKSSAWSVAPAVSASATASAGKRSLCPATTAPSVVFSACSGQPARQPRNKAVSYPGCRSYCSSRQVAHFPRRPASQRHTGSLGGSEIRPLTLAHDAFNGIGGSDGSQRSPRRVRPISFEPRPRACYPHELAEPTK
jgi:hypothetical protein